MVYAQTIGHMLARVTRRFAGTDATAAVKVKHDDIFQAAAHGDREAVAHLLEAHPALLCAQDARGASPLHLAAANGQIETAALLIASGSDLNARDVTGATPLHMAVLGSPEVLVRLLVEAGADVNLRTKKDMTALMLARSYGCAATANCLWTAGATE